MPLQRIDEKPFQVVAEVSAFNQHAYELFAEPLVRSLSNEYAAELGRWFHPQRLQRWAFSDLNPWLAWLGPAAECVKAQRKPANKEQVFRRFEHLAAELVSASLDYCRDLRDATAEALFFQTYGTIYGLTSTEEVAQTAGSNGGERQKLLLLQDALASISKGGYAQALSRAGHLLSSKGTPLPLAQLEFVEALKQKHPDLLPDLTPYERRIIAGKQDLICRYEPEKALAALPQLLSDPTDRQRFITLLDAVTADVQGKAKDLHITDAQTAMLKRIHQVVSAGKMSATAARRSS
jgi:hypothetical protein